MSDSNYRLVSERILADDWGRLTKYEFDLRLRDGTWQRQQRETYDRGNGATCLLYNKDKGTVLLTRQFRLPAFVNGALEFLIETPAGLLEGAEPATRMQDELIEETGYDVSALTHLFDIYMSPGSVTEYLAFFEGEYSDKDKVGEGGGSADEGEDIDVLQIPLTEAINMIENGDIRDAKTIILLQHLTIRLLRKKVSSC
ncbi:MULTISPECIES: NUDIX domain-containing protein [Agrobacterium]|uniref:GDP-mannose pyrophosphatase n=1 Tax=Agrobacterium rosae TaxID=1972867 RepID=A0AAW9F975_9HYPH|nr:MULTISPECIES: NUDIX domain-containing protein [Agrobacterium]MDX8302390.1 NUDIX domain-containing protein [Agrobacterium rosae]POO55664.1 GDP-mannose pyrophosphatase [Agrobacterium rosae]SCX15593.1 GDP-mannose pyrophosphatase NudK [Agrobacterium sp. DSM 25558]